VVYKRIFGFRKGYFYVLFCSISKGTFYGILVIFLWIQRGLGIFGLLCWLFWYYGII